MQRIRHRKIYEREVLYLDDNRKCEMSNLMQNANVKLIIPGGVFIYMDYTNPP